MRTLTKPDSQTNITPQFRPDGTLPGWSRGTNAVKAFVQWALENQKNQCAFCGFIVDDVSVRRAWSVDHVAPKGTGLYPQWTFEPLNLVITCHSCNSVFKREYDSVNSKSSIYEKCTFFIVHPYLDSVDDHLVGTYAGEDDEVEAPLSKSPKGLKTIEMFHLDDPNYIVAINDQALLISLAKWRKSLPAADRSLVSNALRELSGRQ